MCKQFPAFPRLTAPYTAFQKKYFASASAAIQACLGLNLNSSETLSSTSILSNTNAGGLKDWPLEQSHFNKIPSILFLLSTVCFRIAALGIYLANTEWDNGCIQALPQQCQLLFYLFVCLFGLFWATGWDSLVVLKHFKSFLCRFSPDLGVRLQIWCSTLMCYISNDCCGICTSKSWLLEIFLQKPTDTTVLPNFSWGCWNSLKGGEFNQSFPFKLLASFSFNLVLLWRFYRPDCCVPLLSVPESKGV